MVEGRTPGSPGCMEMQHVRALCPGLVAWGSAGAILTKAPVKLMQFTVTSPLISRIWTLRKGTRCLYSRNCWPFTATCSGAGAG